MVTYLGIISFVTNIIYDKHYTMYLNATKLYIWYSLKRSQISCSRQVSKLHVNWEQHISNTLFEYHRNCAVLWFPLVASKLIYTLLKKYLTALMWMSQLILTSSWQDDNFIALPKWAHYINLGVRTRLGQKYNKM